MMTKPILIIGSGLAGYSVAREIRKLDERAPITMIAADAGDYYSKPTLSNALASGRSTQSLVISPAERIARQLNISIISDTKVAQLDIEAQKALWVEGEIDYSSLVMSVGSKAIKVPWEGNALREISHINHINDYVDFRAKLLNARRIVIIGAGLVGCEFADDIRSVGVNVDIVEATAYPLSRFCPEQGAKIVLKALEAKGVNWHLGRKVSAIHRSGKRFDVELDNHATLECDLVLSAVGLTPRIDLAMSASISTKKGIQTNQYLATSAKNVYALGDCSEVVGNFLPFVMPIMFGAKALASTLVTQTPTAVNYPVMPIIVKTPSCPVVMVPPPLNLVGNWELSGAGNDVAATFRDSSDIVRGFALFGAQTKERLKYVQRIGFT